MDPATTTIRQSGQCMDLNTGRLQNNRADLIRYSCTNGGNQRWTNLTASQNLLWTYLSATNMKLINK
jgi:Ricin-type beta-trefoil lectin domain.